MALEDVILRRARPGAVETVLVGGRTILHEGQFRLVDRDAILDAISVALAREPTAAERDRRRLAAAALPVVQAFYRDWLA